MIGANCYRGESERRRGDTKIASMGKMVVIRFYLKIPRKL